MTNQEKFKKLYGPFIIKAGVYDISKCFHPLGVGFLGVYGMYKYNQFVKNNIAAFQHDCGVSGILVLPVGDDVLSSTLDTFLQCNNTPKTTYNLGNSFKGKFEHKGIHFNKNSITVDFKGADLNTLTSIALNLARRSILLKDLQTNTLLLVVFAQ